MFEIMRSWLESVDPDKLGEQELYDLLSRYLVPDHQLEIYGYPIPDPNDSSMCKAPPGKQLRAQLASSYTCRNCTKVYSVNAYGLPIMADSCINHPGKQIRSLGYNYSCCKGSSSSVGCHSSEYHVHESDLELQNYTGFVETSQPEPDKEPNKHGVYALDCEMCFTIYGPELTRVTVVNYKSEVVYEKLVKPTNAILDYCTAFSGIEPGDLDGVSTRLADVQRDLLDMFSSKTILVGHSLNRDMRCLKIFHRRFIDTAQLFPHKRGLPYKKALRTLMAEHLNINIQENAQNNARGHDSKEDASAALRSVMWKAGIFGR